MGQKQLFPTELIYGSPRVLAYDEVAQDQHWHANVMLLEENHLRAATCVARYQQALCRYHSHRVHAWCFEEGDLVLRRVQSAKGTNKLFEVGRPLPAGTSHQTWRSLSGDRRWHTIAKLMEY